MWNYVSGIWGGAATAPPTSTPQITNSDSSSEELSDGWVELDTYQDSKQDINLRTWNEDLTDPSMHHKRYRYLVCNFIDAFALHAHRTGVRQIAEGSQVFVNMLEDTSLLQQAGAIPAHLIDHTRNATRGVAGLILRCTPDAILGLSYNEETASDTIDPHNTLRSYSLRDFLEHCSPTNPNRIWISGESIRVEGLWYKIDSSGQCLISKGSLHRLKNYASFYKKPLIELKDQRPAHRLPRPVGLCNTKGQIQKSYIKRFGYTFIITDSSAQVCAESGNSRAMNDREFDAFMELAEEALNPDEEDGETATDDCNGPPGHGQVIPTHTFDPNDIKAKDKKKFSFTTLKARLLKNMMTEARFLPTPKTAKELDDFHMVKTENGIPYDCTIDELYEMEEEARQHDLQQKEKATLGQHRYS